jgi:hypothetical protein
MSSSVIPAAMSIVDDGAMSGSSPRAGGPSRRRSFPETNAPFGFPAPLRSAGSCRLPAHRLSSD